MLFEVQIKPQINWLSVEIRWYFLNSAMNFTGREQGSSILDPGF